MSEAWSAWWSTLLGWVLVSAAAPTSDVPLGLGSFAVPYVRPRLEVRLDSRRDEARFHDTLKRERGMKRREFIGMAAAGAAGIVLPATPRAAETTSLAPANPRLLDFLHDERVVRDLGRRYREVVPGEDDAQTLAEVILAMRYATVPAALRARLDQQVEREFADGRTVNVNGWILSVSEARQCALYSIQHD